MVFKDVPMDTLYYSPNGQANPLRGGLLARWGCTGLVLGLGRAFRRGIIQDNELWLQTDKLEKCPHFSGCTNDVWPQ